MFKTIIFGCLGILVLGGATGCNRQDTERLGRIGRIAGQRVEMVLGDVGDDFLQRWQQGQERRHKSQLARDIAKRLEIEKDLANCKIEVAFDGEQVELRGVVKDRQQRQHVIELVEAMPGMGKVKDNLKEGEPER